MTARQPAVTGQRAAADRRMRRHADPNSALGAAEELIGDASRPITAVQD